MWVLPLVVGGAAAAVEAGTVNLGPADSIALDQPRVTFGLLDPDTNDLVGPTQFNSAALDTGANGVLLAQRAYLNGESYQPATRSDGSTVHYSETGVAGSQDLTVYQPYGLEVQPNNVSNRFVVNDVRAFGDSTLNLGGFAAIVGMPAMDGRITTMDLTPLSTLENLDYIGVDFPDHLHDRTSGTYDVKLNRIAPSFPGQKQEDDPTPTYAGLSKIENIQTSVNNQATTGSMVLDTGAQLSMISSDTADTLDIDTSATVDNGGDVVDYLDVGGVGGKTSVPLVKLDELEVPTDSGDVLRFTDLTVGVLDIEGINGIFGMNLLTSGYTASIGGTGEGYFKTVGLDFQDPDTGVLRLTLLPEPNTAALLVAGGVLILTIRRRRRQQPA